ncbi:hypothetical protein HDE_12186 [Halotydeus destructor]|nr:hypothetical protein HDE_12186 [Halotydeus destructor]
MPETKKPFFDYINLALNIFGIPMYHQSLTVRVIKYLRFAAYLIGFYEFLDVHRLAHLSELERLFHHVITFYMYIHMLRHVKELESIIYSLGTLMSAAKWSSMIRYARLVPTFTAIYFTFVFIVMYGHKDDMTLIQIAWLYGIRLQSIFNGACFNFFMITVYHIYLRAFLMASESFFESYVKSRTVHPIAVRIAWNDITRLKRRFEACMSIYPVFWLMDVLIVSFMFLDAAVKGKFGPDGPKTTILIILVTGFAKAVSVVMHVDYVDTKVKEMYHEFYHSVMGGPCSQRYDKLMGDIEKEYELGFTAFSFFKLDRTVIISFVSALINLNVLFLQMP